MGVKLSEKITRARGSKSYTDIGRLIGCTGETIRKWESGKSEPGLRLGVRLAAALGVPTDWLVDDTKGFPPPAHTLDDKIVEAVHLAMEPYSSPEGLTPDEFGIVSKLRERNLRRRGDPLTNGVLDAFDAMFKLFDCAHDIALAEESIAEDEAEQSATSSDEPPPQKPRFEDLPRDDRAEDETDSKRRRKRRKPGA